MLTDVSLPRLFHSNCASQTMIYERIRSRRMSTVVLALVIASIVIILWEEYITDLTDQPRPSTSTLTIKPSKSSNSSIPDPSSFKCWLTESFKVIDPCSKCSRSQILNDVTGVCKTTGFSEGIKCQQSGSVSRPCNIPSEHFWTFEIFMIIIAVSGFYFCNYRENLIEKMMMDKINKQIASGV